VDSKVHVATAMSFPTNAGLIFLKDDLTGDNFLVDTGATLSVVPHNAKVSPSGPTLNGANGLPIPTWGTVTKNVRFQGKTFKHTFLQAAVAGPILGIDFLKQFNVTIAPAANKVLFASTICAPSTDRCSNQIAPFTAATQLKSTPGIPPTTANSCTRSLLDPPPSVLPTIEPELIQPIPASVPADVKRLLQKYPSILRTGDLVPKPTHGVVHQINTERHPPVFAKARRLEPAKVLVAQKEFKKLESAGIIRRSKSPWASPLHMVPKKDGSWRPCGDYCRQKHLTCHTRSHQPIFFVGKLY
jgi:hypothetical protein